MPKFTLNGKEIPFEPGETVMEAAWREGIEIPHYCWHPGLSVAANCRMCLVHVESGRQMEMPQLVFDEAGGGHEARLAGGGGVAEQNRIGAVAVQADGQGVDVLASCQPAGPGHALVGFEGPQVDPEPAPVVAVGFLDLWFQPEQ